MHRIAVITCYKDPDYVRARSLRAAVAQCEGVEMLVVKNKRRGVLRYPEMVLRIVWLRMRYRPDAYLLTFRGYELLPILMCVSLGKPLLYDEFINPIEWLREPRPERWAARVPLAPLRWFYRFLLRRCNVVLADTPAHAAYSAQLMGVAPERFTALPVSTDETVFRPNLVPSVSAKRPFTVFYYGNMLPLHGLSYVLEAARQLQSESAIVFRLVGGGSDTEVAVQTAISDGAHITYERWIPFEQLPRAIAAAGLCLAGPFGNTVQARHVVTGKAYQFLASAAPTLVGQSKASEAFRDKQNSLVVPQADSAALADAIRWAAHHPKELVRIGQTGRQLYEQQFSNAVVAATLQRLIDQLF